MMPTEMNAVLTFAALLDPRMKRTDPADAADRAEAWAAAVPAEVSVDAARAAVTEHYRVSREPIMPSDLIVLAGVQPESVWPDRTDEALGMVMRKQLASLGTTPKEYWSDAGVRARVNAVLDARAIEENQ